MYGGMPYVSTLNKDYEKIEYLKMLNETISVYLKYICDGFLFYWASRYDLKSKEYLKTLGKYYACDIGLRNEKINFR